MAPAHIVNFCSDSAKTLLRLYHSFPRPQAVYVSDIVGVEERDEVGLYSARHMACLSTLMWLADEGLLRYTTLIYEEGIEQAVLTHTAFVLLSHETVPAPLDAQGSSWFGALQHALISNNTEQLQALMHHFMARALALPKHQGAPRPTVAPAPANEKAALPTIEEMFSSLAP